MEFFFLPVNVSKEQKGGPCQFCGFAGASRTVNRVTLKDDGSALVMKPEPVAACDCCFDVFNLAQAGSGARGTLVVLPGISQAAMAHLARLVVVSQAASADEYGSLAIGAKTMYERILERSKVTEELLGKDACDPGVFCSVVGELDKGFSNPTVLGLRRVLRFAPDLSVLSAGREKLVEHVSLPAPDELQAQLSGFLDSLA